MGRIAKLKQQARATARGRRIALDHDRAARDKRVEAIAAEAILALGALDDAAGQVRAAEVRVGGAGPGRSGRSGAGSVTGRGAPGDQ